MRNPLTRLRSAFLRPALRRHSARLGVVGTVAVAAAAAACAPDQAPTAVRRIGVASSAAAGSGDTTRDELRRLTEYLFLGDEKEVLSLVDSLFYFDANSNLTCSVVSRILDHTFTDYRNFALNGQTNGARQDLRSPVRQVQRYVVLLSGRCGRLAPANGVPDAALDSGGAVGVISTDSTVSIETVFGRRGQVGVRVLQGTFDEDVLLYVIPKSDSSRLSTTLPQSAPYYDISVQPAQPTPYRLPVDLGFYVTWDDRPPSDHLVLGHEVTPGTVDALQPIFMTTPRRSVGIFGGPAYLKPTSPPPSLRASTAAVPGGFGLLAASGKGTSTNYGGQTEAFSPFGLVSIFERGVNPNTRVTLSNGVCPRQGPPVIPYVVTSSTDLVINYQVLDANNAPVGTRTLLLLRGAGAPRADSLALPNSARRVRFYYGPTLFATRTVPACTN